MGRGHALLLASLTPALGGCSGEVRAPEPRSVILVTCDTLRRDALEPYGAAPGCTPHLARLAQEAVVFDQAWSAAPSTLPSLSSLFTRRTPDELGVTSGNRMLLPPEVDTLTERLREAGLETAAVVSNAVLRRFPTPIGEVALAQGFDHYDDRMTVKERNRQLFERSAPDTVAAGLQWLDARKDPERPFFLWLHFIEPHGPYTSGEPLALSEDDALPAALPLGEDDRGLGQIPRYQALGEDRAPARYRAAYRGEVRHLDQALGVLLEGLRQRGLLETATLVVTADHGESLGEGDWWFSHGQSLAPELLRVPLLIRAPGGSAPARRSQLGRSRCMTRSSRRRALCRHHGAFWPRGPAAEAHLRAPRSSCRLADARAPRPMSWPSPTVAFGWPGPPGARSASTTSGMTRRRRATSRPAGPRWPRSSAGATWGSWMRAPGCPPWRLCT